MARLKLGTPTRRRTTQEDIDRVKEQAKITEKNTGKKLSNKDKGRIADAQSHVPIELNRATSTPTLKQPEPGSIAEKINNILTIEPGSTRDKIGKFFGGGAGTTEKLMKGEELLGGTVPLGANFGAVTSFGGSAIEGAEQAVNAIVPTVRSGQGGILGKYVLGEGATAVNKAAQVGRAATTTRAVTQGFTTNAKTLGLTKSLLNKVGLTIPTVSLLIGAIGSYPFAGFIKEEALQTLSFSTKVSIDSGDLEGAQKSIDQVNELLKPSTVNSLLSTIPYANIVANLKEFFKAAETKNEADQEALNKLIAIQTGEIESNFARERRISDEAARERELAAQEEDTARFAEIEERRRQEDNEEKRLNSIYFQLLRDKKFEEAEEFRITNFPTE